VLRPTTQAPRRRRNRRRPTRTWVAEARLEKLPPGGGFARLRSEGTWVKRCEYTYAVTETAPGHAALFTGKTPRQTGIVGNKVWRGDLGKAASLLEDKDTKLISFDPQQDRMPGVIGISSRSSRPTRSRTS
jgi:hypothetical protein